MIHIFENVAQTLSFSVDGFVNGCTSRARNMAWIPWIYVTNCRYVIIESVGEVW